MDFDPKVLTRILVIVGMICAVLIAIWVRRRAKLKVFSFAFESYLDVPRGYVYTANNVVPRTIYFTSVSGQQFIVLKIRDAFFRIAVMRTRWSGYGRPPIAFSGWTSRIDADQVIDPESLLDTPQSGPSFEDRLADGRRD
jgi:hypothetical protein